jgi:hypothetical protein
MIESGKTTLHVTRKSAVYFAITKLFDVAWPDTTIEALVNELLRDSLFKVSLTTADFNDDHMLR